MSTQIKLFILWYNNSMITTDFVKIKYTDDDILIERELQNLGIEPLRWSVAEVLADGLLISVSYIK